ncbi:acyltransferase [Salinisphaera sp. LB1]|uniref:acyltransferase n=1 Tax=Salinisphaera sp. LB1 TaxID=2183911 RepID=UPI000D707D0B|nr:acyltransferase [Salinisphaera sp. LB1]AWN14686.1 Acyltransferase family protein [Salinisphaera sp. LB1]
MPALAGPVRGIAIVVGLIGLTILGGIPLVPASIVKLALPPGRARDRATDVVLGIAKAWARGSNGLIFGISGTRLRYQQQMADDPDGRYVLISNHQCWADVMLLIRAIDPQLPFPRFFIKEQLRWLPVIGLACWALDFPFMKRHSRAAIEKHPELRNEDMHAVRRACEVFRRQPVSLVNYAEGTRSTPAKRAAANSPYRTLLPPKAGGTAFAVNAMRDVLDGILDMTVAYIDTPEPKFWDVLCGRIPEVAVRVRYLAVPPELADGDYGADPQYRDRFKAWLGELWAAKDAEVAAIQDPENPQRAFHDLATGGHHA